MNNSEPKENTPEIKKINVLVDTSVESPKFIKEDETPAVTPEVKSIEPEEKAIPISTPDVPYSEIEEEDITEDKPENPEPKPSEDIDKKQPNKTEPDAPELVLDGSAGQPLYRKKYVGTGKKLIVVAIATIILTICASGLWLYAHHSNPQEHKINAVINLSPVPATVMAAVDYKVYYPDITKLPTGYKLDEHSFNVLVKNGIAYTVSYEVSKKIVFSLQTKPSDNELAAFRSNYIPLRTDFQTPIGAAQIGAYNSQTLVSLPLFNGPWIVITAPSDINQDQLKQVINSLRS